MRYTREKDKNIFLYDTKVENIFINEYMATAPGDFVKVYLLGCMLSENGQSIENDMLAKQLNIDEKEIQKAWKFWSDMGVVKVKEIRHNNETETSIVIQNLKELMFGNIGKSTLADDDQKEDVLDDSMKKLFGNLESSWGIALSGKDLEEITSWPDFYGVTLELISFGVDYCSSKNKQNIRYLEKIIQGWSEDGCKTAKDAQEYLNEVDQKYYRYRRVLKALGFTRNATEAEMLMMDNWFDIMHFNMDRVLGACEKTCGISNPNLNYVNRVLENWHKESTNRGTDVNKTIIVTQTVLNEYLDYLRKKEEDQAEKNKREIYKNIPKIEEIDEEISSIGARMTKAIVMKEKGESKMLGKSMDNLLAERAILLTENNYEMDYTDMHYSCEICKDTGITDEGEKCTCINQRIEEAEIWQKSRK